MKYRLTISILLLVELICSCSISRNPIVNLQLNSLISQQQLQDSDQNNVFDKILTRKTIKQLKGTNTYINTHDQSPVNYFGKHALKNSNIRILNKSIHEGLKEVMTRKIVLQKINNQIQSLLIAPSFTTIKNTRNGTEKVNEVLVLGLSFLLIALALTILIESVNLTV